MNSIRLGILPLLAQRQPRASAPRSSKQSQKWWAASLTLPPPAAQAATSVDSDSAAFSCRSKTGVVRDFMGPKFSQGRESLIRGISLVAAEGSPSPPSCPDPHHSLSHPFWWKQGSDYLGLPGLVWDHQLGLARIGSFPMRGKPSFILPAWERITSCQFVLEVVRQGIPFFSWRACLWCWLLSRRHYSGCSSKREALCEEVSSLPNKGALEYVMMLYDRGWGGR